MAIHQLPVAAVEVTRHIALDHSGRALRQWYASADAAAILAEIVGNPPAYGPAALRNITTGQIMFEYDRTDVRVLRLDAYLSGWFAATGAFDLTVDEVIGDAVAKHRAETARLDRVTELLNEGFTLGEARRMAEAA